MATFKIKILKEHGQEQLNMWGCLTWNNYSGIWSVMIVPENGKQGLHYLCSKCSRAMGNKDQNWVQASAR